jgi:cytoskeleton protein RodZ
MSADDFASPSRVGSPPSSAERVTAAGALRALRVSKGLSLEDVSGRLKFPARHIEALESERFEDLPKGLGLKSLIKNYAKLLGIDSKPLEDSLSHFVGHVEGGIGNHNSTRTLDSHAVTPLRPAVAWFWWVLIAAVVAVAAAVALSHDILPTAWLPAGLEGWFK